ncbi:flagellar biosynthetic protein FliO [Marinobacter sp. SS13-12]|uniref:flagellar biosynthetic protein FliO n=1 Tax=Marinobacter sp. SS13-12 TaxID=3050451 RepID=UPI0025531B0C|nr:flagellar biosynthetic protein FliO [Marinobacter sp. SS13-12]MDK8463936.1 flagellar biosynthetic protein FliO [Marinobacter sp. SS13-12]
MTLPSGLLARKGLAGLILTLLTPALATAQEQEAPAREATSAPDTLVTMLTLGVGLLAVLALIFGCAWIVRRMGGMSGGNTRAIKVVSVMPMGTRERIALIEVGGTQILLGVTPSTIRTLHVFDEPVVSAGEPVSGDFARKLQGMIGKSWGSGSSSKEGS